MNKTKRQQKQDNREIELFDDIISGRVGVETRERPKKRAQANRIGGGAKAEEQDELAGRYIRILRFLLPGILAKLSSIDDYRDPRRIKHSLPAIVLYGILIFLSNTSSRRAANREIGGSQVAELLIEFVPEFVSTPHADTLERLLKNIEVNDLEDHYSKIIAEFIKTKNFNKLNRGRFHVLVDGTQKFSRSRRWDDNALSRNADEPGKERYFAYVLESVIVLDSGILLPLFTETLENGGSFEGNGKQDCETKAFKRLAARLKKLLGTGCVTIIADGLYATGPIMSLCKYFGWEYMITLKKDCLKSVWEDFEGLRKIEAQNNKEIKWGDRNQAYSWSNGIEYCYGANHKKIMVNVMTCVEHWHEEHPAKGGRPEDKITEYAWVSSFKITKSNAFDLGMLGRRRWRIENHFKTLKYDGYRFMHCFSYNWNAMKGYHYTMKIASFINVLISSCETMQDYVQAEGKKGVIKKVWLYLTLKSLTESGIESDQRLMRTPFKQRKTYFQKLKFAEQS